MASTTLIWITLTVLQLGCTMYVNEVYQYHGFCLDVLINQINALQKLDNCTVILGDLKLQLQRTRPRDFVNVSFPKLKEVTGCVAIYGASGLESVGGLFPNLMRVRGNTLINNYALIISNMPRLREIGLANLLKVDRGGVIIWPGPLTCYVHSVDWRAIAPNARHVLSGIDVYNPCKTLPCSCTDNSTTNFCWNNMKCQRFLEGPEAERCNPECVGCLKRDGSICSLCRYYTYRNKCLNTCPNGTIPLTDTNYCVTIDECTHLERWPWNNTCVSECPQNYVKQTKGTTTCVPCENCNLTCNNVTIQTLSSIQEAARCVYIKGHLSIHVRAPPETMKELRYYLKSIQEVTDYIEIRGSLVITSLDFLPALKRIRGENLFSDKYSLVIHDMHSLQTLFTANVTHHLKVDRGSVSFYRNQMLCVSEIEKLVRAFPVPPTELEIPQGLNGYSGSCDEAFFNLTIHVKNETNVVARFNPESNTSEHTVLYVKVPAGLSSAIVPEVCSDSEWHAISIQSTVDKSIEVELFSLSPATKYAICIEKFDPKTGRLARSSVKIFTTFVGKPEPPFIVELTASSSEVVVIRWVDHLDYLPYIVRYELDVTLIDLHNLNNFNYNHCIDYDYFDWEEDFSVHARVMRPPKKYDRSCESMCGVLSTATAGAMVDEYFDVCNIIKDCHQTHERPLNKTVGNYIQNIALDIYGKRKNFQVGGLAPYQNYKFQLRACTSKECSVSARNIVKTLRAINADIPTITFLTASEKGDVSVKWDPPKTINGAVLSYTVEVTPVIKFNDYSLLLPHTLCVSGNITSLIIKTQIAAKYIVRLCTKTLASSYSCGVKMKVLVSSEVYSNVWLSGAIFGMFLSVTSCMIGWKYRKRNINDDILLVNATSMYRNESEPPAVMMSDFAPIYSIPIRDTHL
ncbi:unnamed protein product [Pieris macdunnoughi]|uniref:receptor protein-tyrosine kinase n=2 Tax=Pieris macdunnoughi TaxID=345717 RepID=A0A821QZS8_9NEOP|nr:unnamed protein product [Pieris macdunnoughi]